MSSTALNGSERRQVVITLMGVAEAAKYLSVSRQRFSVLEQRKDFPRPAAELACGRIWLAKDIQLWNIKHPRVNGRPPKFNRRSDDPKD